MSKVNIQQQGIQEGDMEDIIEMIRKMALRQCHTLSSSKKLIINKGKTLKIKSIKKKRKFHVFYSSIKSPDL